MASPSDLVAALHVPERQREEGRGEEEEEGIEHGWFSLESGTSSPR
jgi:hypothetical protein